MRKDFQNDDSDAFEDTLVTKDRKVCKCLPIGTA